MWMLILWIVVIYAPKYKSTYWNEYNDKLDNLKRLGALKLWPCAKVVYD